VIFLFHREKFLRHKGRFLFFQNHFQLFVYSTCKYKKFLLHCSRLCDDCAYIYGVGKMVLQFHNGDLARVTRVVLDQRASLLRIFLDDDTPLREANGERSAWFASTDMMMVSLLVGLLEVLTGFHFQLASYGRDVINPTWLRTTLPKENRQET